MPHGNALDIQINENMLEKKYFELNLKHRTCTNIMNDSTLKVCKLYQMFNLIHKFVMFCEISMITY